MTDTQVITIVIALIASVGAVMYNNSWITDVGKRIDDLRDAVNTHIDDKFSLLMERLQRMEDNITNQLASHDTRIHKLEHPGER